MGGESCTVLRLRLMRKLEMSHINQEDHGNKLCLEKLSKVKVTCTPKGIIDNIFPGNWFGLHSKPQFLVTKRGS